MEAACRCEMTEPVAQNNADARSISTISGDRVRALRPARQHEQGNADEAWNQGGQGHGPRTIFSRSHEVNEHDPERDRRKHDGR